MVNMAFEPELGQVLWGQKWESLEPPLPVECWLEILKSIVGEDDGWYDVENEVFSMHPYWWGDDDDPRANRPNFKCGDVEIYWYKHICRGMSTNTKMSDMEWHKMFAKCVQKAIKIREAEQQ